MNNGEITVQGMILLSAPQGEYDKRLVILTKEKGKITVFAKGARRGKSVLGAKTTPFSFGTFVIGGSGSAYYLRQAEITDYFMEMRQDFERSCYGSYFLEFANYYSREENGEIELLKLLYQSIRALAKGTIPYRLVRHIFELKAFVINGEYPQVFECMHCKELVTEGYFSVEKAGVFCEKCKSEALNGIYIDWDVLYTMQYVITTEISKLYTFVLKEETFAKFQKIMTLYVRRYVDKEFKSLIVLEENC